jgi:hypothetical protein
MLTLKQTHIWPGAVGKTAGRVAGMIPGAGAVGGALSTAGSVAGSVAAATGSDGSVEAPGTEIILEYKMGPPAKLSLVSVSEKDKTANAAGNAKTPARQAAYNEPRFNTFGLNIGTAFATPGLIFTLQGTVSPANNFFMGFGLDLGLVATDTYYYGYEGTGSVYGYHSLYPFFHLGYFGPFAKKGGWYIGGGCGVMFANYYIEFSRNNSSSSSSSSYEVYSGTYRYWSFALDLITGFNFWDWMDLSYTLRTNFMGASHKITIGFNYRFR